MTPEFAVANLPADVVSNYPEFTKFIEAFYKWGLENGFDSIINNSKGLLYQQLYNKEYEQRIIKSLGINISLVDSSPFKTEMLYKLVNEFIETRGTKVSFELIFQIMFNETVSIQFNRTKLFRCSSSNYLRTSVIVISGIYPLNMYSRIRGIRSNTSTGIESITPYYINNTRYYIIECNNLYDKFIINEPLEITNLSYMYNEVHIPLIHVDILSPGILYKKGDKIIPSNNLFAGEFVITSVTKGTIDDIKIINGGINYKVGDKVTAMGSNHFDAFVNGIDSSGTINSIKIRNKGYNFEDIPLYKIKTSNGSGAIIEFLTTTIGNVKSIDITAGSIIYDTAVINYSCNTINGTGLSIKNKVIPNYMSSRYIDKDGMLGYNCIISNSENFNNHTYDIVSSVPAVKYSNIINQYANPSGYYYNSKYVNENNVELKQIEVTGELTRK